MREVTGSPFPPGKGETFSGETYKTERKTNPLLFQYRITIVHLSKNDKKILSSPAERPKQPCPSRPGRQQAPPLYLQPDLPTTSCLYKNNG